MIRRVRLENWRAYRQLDLPVDPGVTFLVAANGVGKSSLLEAVRWALSPGVVPGDRTVIRHGHNEATATVTLLSDQGELEVRRVMRLRGNRGLSSSFDATLNGRKLHESDFGRLLARGLVRGPGFRLEDRFPHRRPARRRSRAGSESTPVSGVLTRRTAACARGDRPGPQPGQPGAEGCPRRTHGHCGAAQRRKAGAGQAPRATRSGPI